MSFEALRLRSDHQKALLIKAKYAISQYRLRVENLEQELAKEKAFTYEQAQGMEEIAAPIGVLARVKIDGDIWC